jgi:aquaporin Z
MVAVAVGLAVLAMAIAVGHVSGGHFNPAVTLGLVAANRFDMGNAVGYILAQVLGGLAATLLLAIILGGAQGGKWGSFMAAANTFGGAGQFSLLSVMLIEIVVTALLLIVFVSSTSRGAPAGQAPIAIGMALIALHIVSLPVSGGSLNPARSTAVAVVAGGKALGDLWVFWVAPIIGGVVGGVVGDWLQRKG